MATSFKKTLLLNPLAKFGEKNTADAAYWKNLDVPITKKEYGAITHVEFCPVTPYSYAVTNSTRVQIYSARSNQILRTLSRFKEVAHCGSFRSDGKLLVAGSDEPVVRLFEPNTRSLLRVFQGHKGPVRVTRFLSDNLRIMSGSHDKTVRVWDIATEKELSVYSEHQDYVRCGVVCKSSPDLFLTGSYDHTAKLFDARTGDSVLTVEHGQPVESVLMFPSGGIFMTAGGNVVKVWDALAGGKILTTLSHHKTVTSLCFCSNHRRFMSASLDRHVKVYDVGSYQVVHSLDYPGSILSVAVAPDDSVLAVGMVDGLLSVQHRNRAAKAAETKRKKVSFHYRLKGKTFSAQKEDLVISNKRREKMERYDKLLKRFEHSKALDAAMELHVRQTSPEVTMGVLQELIRRGVLRPALAGRDMHQLQGILRFIQKNLCKPHFTSTLLDVIGVVLDLYEGEIAGNAVLETQMARIKNTVDSEVAYLQDLLQVKGMLETLFSAAEPGDSSSASVAVER